MISDYRVILWLGHNSRVKSYYYLKRCSRILILAILSIKMVKNSYVIACSNPFKFNSNSFQFTNESANENQCKLVTWIRILNPFLDCNKNKIHCKYCNNRVQNQTCSTRAFPCYISL